MKWRVGHSCKNSLKGRRDSGKEHETPKQHPQAQGFSGNLDARNNDSMYKKLEHRLYYSGFQRENDDCDVLVCIADFGTER